MLLEGVEIAIAHIDVFLMVGVVIAWHSSITCRCRISVNINRCVRKILGGWMVCHVQRPCHGQLARRICLTRQDVCHAVAAFHAWLPSHEDSICIVLP